MSSSHDRPTAGHGTWATHLTRQLALACSRLYLVAVELLAPLAIETRQRVRTGPFGGAIDLDVGVIATLDRLDPRRRPSSREQAVMALPTGRPPVVPAGSP